MDPLIPFGFLMRCLRAYSNGVQGDSEELEDMKRAKADRNEELKRKSSLNPLEIEQEFSDEDKSDSFEEISCFERHQTDSDIKAHISQVSAASNDDTLAGTSILTGTEFKNSNIELVSPIDSIQSATSLEEDSLPITIQKSEKTNGCDDQQPTTSEDTIKNGNKKYVDDFIEKYVLDAAKCDDGTIKPVLRKASKTESEDNIIFDVSRETLSVQNLQSKVHRVASSLVGSVSSTIDQITKTNRPIIRANYSSLDDEIRSIENDECVSDSPSCDFIFSVPKDPFLSPFYASDDMLVQFPSIKILSLSLDTCLDDSIMFAKRLRDLDVDLTFDILDGLPHGFLNFSRVSFF
jgi:hormone-sensitive lipase